jgi:hypothetical protein
MAATYVCFLDEQNDPLLQHVDATTLAVSPHAVIITDVSKFRAAFAPDPVLHVVDPRTGLIYPYWLRDTSSREAVRALLSHGRCTSELPPKLVAALVRARVLVPSKTFQKWRADADQRIQTIIKCSEECIQAGNVGDKHN